MLTGNDYCDKDLSATLIEMGFPTKMVFIGEQATSGLIQLYEAQKFLREEHQLHIEVRYYQNMWYEYELKEAEGKILAEGCAFKTYEEALSTAVYMATEHLKENGYGKGSNTCQ